jgi:hypothetical protein
MSYAEGDMNSNNNNKPTYAQVAASPPLDDENDTNGEFGEHQQPGQKEKLVNVSAVGGAHFSKPTPKQEKGEQTNIVAKGIFKLSSFIFLVKIIFRRRKRFYLIHWLI